MNILYIHQYFKFPDEGGGTRSYDLSTKFALAGHKVIVLSATSDTKYKNKKRWNIVYRDGVEVYYVYMPYNNSMSYLQRMWVFFKFLWLTSFKALAIKADLVLATSTPLTIGIPALVKKCL